jgi:hypothetical protein
VQGEAEVLEVGRRGARDVRVNVVVVVRLLADGRDVDDADPGGQRPGAQIGQGVARGAQHGEPLLEQPRVHLAVGIDEIRAGEPRDGGAERDRSGGDDFLLHVAVPDTDALYAFVIDRLTERREVADVRTSVVYEHIRRPVLEPLGSDTRT